jgi:hypothetical protein
MRPRFQADEDLNLKIIAGVLRREPSVDFRTAKAANTLGLKDREVLAAAARDGRILVSHDRETMPAHFAGFIAPSTSAGLLIVSQNLEIGETIESAGMEQSGRLLGIGAFFRIVRSSYRRSSHLCSSPAAMLLA